MIRIDLFLISVLTLIVLIIDNAHADTKYNCNNGLEQYSIAASSSAACIKAGQYLGVISTLSSSGNGNGCIDTASQSGIPFCLTGEYIHDHTCPVAGTQKSSGMYDLGTNADAPIPSTACDDGCETTYSGSGVTKRAMINGVYHYFFGSGNYSHTGQQCTTGTPSPSGGTVPPNTCDPSTQQSGQVNGVTVCLPKSDTNVTNTTTTPPVTDPNTGNTTTTTNTTTNNTTNNTTTNITTTTTTAPDGTKTETKSEITTKNPPSNFCQQNPTDPTCLKQSQVCVDNPETLGCATLGTVTDSIVGTEQKGISSITPKTVGGSGSCPAPITTSFMGRTITFTYDLPCQAASMLRPLILALSWLAAGIIFIGGVRQ